MRILAWSAGGFAAAAFAAEYFLPLEGLPYIAAALFLFGAVLLLPKIRNVRAVLFLCFGALGLLAWQGHYVRHVLPCEEVVGQEVTVTARVTDFVTQGDGYESVTVRITEGAPTEKAVLYFYDQLPPELTPGDIITVTIQARSALYRNGERQHYNTAQNQNLLGYVQGQTQVIGHDARTWLYGPQWLCHWVKQQCDKLFTGENAAFMKALLTGDTTDLRQQTSLYSNMRLAGVLHVVAVSGMHIAVLVAFVRLVLGGKAKLVCIPVLVVFMLMSGCRASVVRAVVMQCLWLMAPLVHREDDPPTSLFAALLLILLVNPMAVGGVGLQLSFACMAGFVSLLPLINGWAQEHLPEHTWYVRVVWFFWNGMTCSLCAAVFSLPVAAWYFGSIPLLSPITNILTLWFVEIAFAAGYVLCAIGSVFPALGTALAAVLSWGLHGCTAVYKAIASVPYGCLYVEKDSAVLWLVLTYGLCFLWYGLKKRYKTLRVIIPTELCIIGLCLVLVTDGVSLGDEQASLSALDVGQGQCIVLTDDSAAIVIDCGGSGQTSAGDTAADHLLAAGKNRVDMLILTHLHDDHANGVLRLLERIPVDYLVLPPENQEEETGLRESIIEAARQTDTAVVTLEQAYMAQAGDMTLDLYLPQGGSDINEQGLVVLASLGDETALIMGDGGTESELVLLQEGLVPDVDILVVGHHGSQTASGAIFLKAAQAETAVISVGRNNYGLPNEDILARLDEYCLQVLRTDEQGTITLDMGREDKDYG